MCSKLLFSVFIPQDEEQDPLLHGFSQLKDQLVTVSGEYTAGYMYFDLL